MRIEGKETVTTNDSGKDETISWQFKAVVVVAIVVLVTFTPVIIFVHGKTTNREERSGELATPSREFNTPEDLWSCTSVSASQLKTSVCNRFLYQMPSPSDSSSDNNTPSNVATPSNCSFESTEKELNVLSRYSSLVTPACAEGILSLMCRYVYRPCSIDPSITPSTTVTQAECLSLKDDICKDVWQYIDVADTGCLTSFTGCNNLNSDHPTDQNKTTKTPLNANTTATAEGPPAVVCKTPFIPPHDPKFGPCVPPCPSEDTAMEKSLLTASRTVAVLTISVQYICSFIIFYTWARAKELRRFPHIITLFMAVLNLMRAVILSIPFIVGQQKTMCQYEDYHSSFEYGGTTFAIIQGATIQFTVLSTLILLCCSVFNVFVAIWTSYVDSFVLRHPKLALLLESILATVVPLCMVITVHKTGSYIPDWLLFLSSIPDSNDVIFYTYTLPAQVLSICGMIMCILIVKRIKESTTLRERIMSSDERGRIAQVALSRRFLVLVVFIPISFLVMFTTVETFLTYEEFKVEKDAAEYASCIFFGAPPGETCSSGSSIRAYVAMVIIFMVYLAAFSILLVLYSFIPTPAIRVWTKHKEKLCNLF